MCEARRASARRRRLDLIVASLCAISIVAVIVDFVARRAAAIIVVVVFARCNQTPHFSLGIPVLVWGSPNQNGDPRTNMGMKTLTDLGIPIPKRGSPNVHTKTGIPEPIWGCKSNESPNRFGDPQTKTGIPESPYQNGDPRTNMGIVQSLTHTNMGFIPIWGPTELIPKLERHSKWGPHISMGIPISVWAGICQYSKSGSPHTDMGFIPIWGPTYVPLELLSVTGESRDYDSREVCRR